MVRFVVVLIILIITAGFSLLYLGNRDYKVIKDGGKARTWSKENQDKLSNMLRWMFRIFAIGLIIYFIIPMAIDIPNLVRKDYRVVEGYPRTINKGPYGSWFLLQSVHMEDATVYYFGYPPIDTKKEYRLYYLPRSKFGVGIIQTK